MAAVLQETRDQQEAYDYVHSNFGNQDLIMGEVFQPKITISGDTVLNLIK